MNRHKRGMTKEMDKNYSTVGEHVGKKERSYTSGGNVN
jgi:hypothetical protein